MISEGSRYVDSNMLEYDNHAYWGIWRRVRELLAARERLSYKEHKVKSHEIGCLDILAVKYYRNERLWWFIAAFNNITDPVNDMYVGQVLIVPDILYVQKFLLRT